jgi:sigma-B regulation protein RsbU (phosphoserine phosphatase)
MQPNGQDPATILVVKDDPVTLETINTLLDPTGYKVLSTSKGGQCLEEISQVQPDVILVDVAMAGSDDLEPCRRLKDDPRLNHIPVVLITAGCEDVMLESALDSWAIDFIRKPLNRIELLSRIRSALHLRQSAVQQTEAEMLKSVIEKAGEVCHSLNQPLQYVLGAVQILLIDMPPEDKKYKSVDTIREKIEQMGTITRKLAEVTRYRAN